MEGTPKPPPVAPRPPERTVEIEPDPRVRRLQTWLAVVTALAVVAAGVAAYALSEATKEEEVDDTPLRTLRVDFRAFESETRGRLSQLEGTVADAPKARDVADIRKELDSIDKRVAELAKEEQGADEDDLATRIDDLEQRVEDLEDEPENGN